MQNFRKTIHIKVPIEEVFNALINPLTIELWSGFSAEIEAAPGTRFSLFEGDITGIIKNLEPPTLLEQAWDFGDQEEESLVRFELFQEASKTRLELSHVNIPDEAYENIETGWKEYFLGALKSYLET